MSEAGEQRLVGEAKGYTNRTWILDRMDYSASGPHQVGTQSDDFCVNGNVAYLTVNYLHGRFLYKPGIQSWRTKSLHWMISTLSETDIVMPLLLTWTATLNMVNQGKKNILPQRYFAYYDVKCYFV